MSWPIPLEDRLAGRYIVDPQSGCWLWQGDKRNGYGSVWVDGVRQYAHRAVWEFHNGPIPDGMHACHHCDTPACVRPDHIFLGTQADNILDMRRKGRGAKPPLHQGERHHRAKLTAADVVEIRSRYRRGDSQYQIAAEYGVTQSNISAIVRRAIWTSVAEGEAS